MNAATRLVAMVSLLWALAVAGDAGREQSQVSSPVQVRGGCEEFGCGSNHNETLVCDAEPVRPSSRWSRWLATVKALLSTKVRAGCDEFGCGTNHNETLVRDAAR